MTKWYQKASVQTALVTGAFLILVSLGSGLFSLFQESRKLTHEREEKMNGAIIDFSERARKTSSGSSAIDLSPDFQTFNATLDTMKKLNAEASAHDTSLNIDEMHRYIMNYGRDETKKEFFDLINSYAESHSAANNYLVTLLKSGPESGAVKKYIKLLNSRSQCRSELHNFIINLKSDDFTI